MNIRPIMKFLGLAGLISSAPQKTKPTHTVKSSGIENHNLDLMLLPTGLNHFNPPSNRGARKAMRLAKKQRKIRAKSSKR